MTDEIKKKQEEPATKGGGEDLTDEQLEEASGGTVLDNQLTSLSNKAGPLLYSDSGQKVRTEDLTKADESDLLRKQDEGELFNKA